VSGDSAVLRLAAQELVQWAMDRRSLDNISVVILRLDWQQQQPQPQPQQPR
jgi:serine/threonine protein phosphatase PrpC